MTAVGFELNAVEAWVHGRHFFQGYQHPQTQDRCGRLAAHRIGTGTGHEQQLVCVA
jgi:hypothetical protein